MGMRGDGIAEGDGDGEGELRRREGSVVLLRARFSRAPAFAAVPRSVPQQNGSRAAGKRF